VPLATLEEISLIIVAFVHDLKRKHAEDMVRAEHALRLFRIALDQDANPPIPNWARDVFVVLDGNIPSQLAEARYLYASDQILLSPLKSRE
jgi:hypothetical protein